METFSQKKTTWLPPLNNAYAYVVLALPPVVRYEVATPSPIIYVEPKDKDPLGFTHVIVVPPVVSSFLNAGNGEGMLITPILPRPYSRGRFQHTSQYLNGAN